MKKFMNDPADMAADSLAGFVSAHADLVCIGGNGKFVRRAHPGSGKVAVISGGGAGHEPLHAGFVGKGMLDAACPGHFFTSPTPDQIVGAIEAVDQGKGVLLVVKNYDGDVMNFEIGGELAAAAGHRLETVVVSDDASVAKGGGIRRRGIAGTLFVEKVVGAAAEEGRALEDVASLGRHAANRTHTVGVALRGATLPTASRETFVLGEADIEFGVGIHGEAGGKRLPMCSADEIVSMICGSLAEDMAAAEGEILLFVNGLGGTPQSELYLVYGLARTLLSARGFAVERSLVGSYVTSLDMAGLSITVALLDSELKQLWDAPVRTAALNW